MFDRRFLTLFVIMFVISGVISLMVWQIFFLERKIDHMGRKAGSIADTAHSIIYEDIDLIMPVKAFLKRGVNSSELSVVRRLFVSQWVSSNQNDVIKLVVYAQGATSFEEAQKALYAAIEKEGSCNNAISFVKNALETIKNDPALIMHVDKSLAEGFTTELHTLRGELMNVQDDREYRKLKIEYRKKLDQWMNDKHGQLLDQIIAQI